MPRFRTGGMTEEASWVGQNWFNVIQTAGIVGGLLFGACAARREAKAREFENHLKITALHRELWSGVTSNPSLARVVEQNPDIVRSPITLAEQEFLNLAINHFQTGWRFAKSGSLVGLDEMTSDVRNFFSLPLPRRVWEKSKQFRNLQFVRFVEEALKSNIPSVRPNGHGGNSKEPQ